MFGYIGGFKMSNDNNGYAESFKSRPDMGLNEKEVVIKKLANESKAGERKSDTIKVCLKSLIIVLLISSVIYLNSIVNNTLMTAIIAILASTTTDFYKSN